MIVFNESTPVGKNACVKAEVKILIRKGDVIMSETIIAALIGAGISIMTTVLTLLVNAFIEKNKVRVEVQQKREITKRERLTDVYTDLLSIINSFPRESPNDILKNIEYPPRYSLESFKSIIEILNYQIGDYRRSLEKGNVDLDAKNHIESQIRNREYAIDQMLKIQEEYFNARENYRIFCKNKKMLFDLYAGQDVKNNIVEFEVIIHNVFVSGQSVGDVYDSRDNKIEIIRRRVIDSMRNDIGLS